MCFDLQKKAAQTEKTGPMLERPILRIEAPPPPKFPTKGPIPIAKVGPKEAHSEFWRGLQGPKQKRATLYSHVFSRQEKHCAWRQEKPCASPGRIKL